jgi:hypothetical protein
LRARSKKNGPVPRDRPAACLERLIALLPPPTTATAPPTAAAPAAAAIISFRGRGGRHVHRGSEARHPDSGSHGRPDRAKAPEESDRRGCYNLGEPPAWPLRATVGASRQKTISHSVQPSFPLPCRSMRDLVVTAINPSRQFEPTGRFPESQNQHNRAGRSCQGRRISCRFYFKLRNLAQRSDLTLRPGRCRFRSRPGPSSRRRTPIS